MTESRVVIRHEFERRVAAARFGGHDFDANQPGGGAGVDYLRASGDDIAEAGVLGMIQRQLADFAGEVKKIGLQFLGRLTPVGPHRPRRPLPPPALSKVISMPGSSRRARGRRNCQNGGNFQ